MRIPRTDARRKLLGALLCTFSVAACGPAPEGEPAGSGSTEQPVVYGNDDRMDVYAHPDATLRQYAMQASAVMVDPFEIDDSDPNNVVFTSLTLGEYGNLCPGQRFIDDPSPGFCSGTLIDDDLLLTAGHCVESAADCRDFKWAFNFYRPDANSVQTMTTQDIFSCKEIVVRRDNTSGGRTLDYAIIRLDRPAAPRFTPAPIRPGNAAMTTGANVAVIGSGSGIPLKIDSGGIVRNGRASPLDYFTATTDTFGGNSGSAVYDMSSHTIAGILVRGEADYVVQGSCYVVNECSQNGTDCDGEEITYVRPAIEAFCAANTSVRLCNTTPPPPTSFDFTASNTQNATVNTTRHTVELTAGQSLTVGTCGLTGASATGDTWLRVNGPSGIEVASNDDGCATGRGSNVTFTAGAAGNYEIIAGCYGNTSCSGTVAWTIGTATPPATSGTFNYSSVNSDSARQNTTNENVTLAAGQRLSFGTCNVTGASGTGDSFIRLYNAAGTQVKFNDDGAGCGSLSHATYTVPAGAGGTYQIRAGCYGNTSCSGTVGWTVQ
ncbi:serine protease [Myxococcus xanthus]|uniref:Serine protease n=1 Tax=Myxococcus xanthus TaxID=34 RepID=A0A7Y4IE31_MYXXA|nr:serine protease [Myxococcus xanthus]NOJ77583.1 trypsin-like peptidase domain-containing protein [Myxococcus xanthus]NOJ87325.1 trypsin-like peptidase domain-containing protein [Myxococcus xanthus]